MLNSEDILAGKRVVLTRAVHQNKRFIELLKNLNAIPIIFPTIEIHPVKDMTLIDDANQRITDFDYIIFTSSNAVEIFFQRMMFLNKSNLELRSIKIAAVGKSTAFLLMENGIENVLIPSHYSSNEIPAILGDIRDAKILIPQSNLAKEEMIIQLKASGGNISAITIYENSIPSDISPTALQQNIDYITFTSASTVDGWVNILKQHNIQLLPGFKYIAIGPETNLRAKELGINDAIVAKEHTIDGMIETMINHELSTQIILQ